MKPHLLVPRLGKALTLLLSTRRQTQRIDSAQFARTPVVNISLPTGTLRLHRRPNDGPIAYVARIRSDNPAIAERTHARVSVIDGASYLDFVGPDVSAQRTVVSIELDVYLPDGVGCTARTRLGNILAESVDGDCNLRTSVGRIDATISKAWAGKTLRLTTSVGDVKLRVPRDANLSVRSDAVRNRLTTSFESKPNGVPLEISSSLGRICIDAT
jgi:hypothetical protein